MAFWVRPEKVNIYFHCRSTTWLSAVSAAAVGTWTRATALKCRQEARQEGYKKGTLGRFYDFVCLPEAGRPPRPFCRHGRGPYLRLARRRYYRFKWGHASEESTTFCFVRRKWVLLRVKFLEREKAWRIFSSQKSDVQITHLLVVEYSIGNQQRLLQNSEYVVGLKQILIIVLLMV